MPVVVRASSFGVSAIKRMYSGPTLQAARRAGLEAALAEMSAQAQHSTDEQVYSRTVEWTRTGAYGNSLNVGGEHNIHKVELGRDSVVFGSDVPQAEWLEDGAAPHDIYPKTKKALAFISHGRLLVRPMVHHPGFAARRVLARALESGSAAIAEAYARAFESVFGGSSATLLMVRSSRGRTAASVSAASPVRIPSSRIAQSPVARRGKFVPVQSLISQMRESRLRQVR